MRADHAVRHNAAVGALVGLAVGDALSTLSELPPAVCGGPSELPPWGDVAAISFETGEALLSRDLLNMGLGPTDIIAAAIALADPDASPPLLGDPDAVLMCALVQASMLGQFACDPSLASSTEMADALRSVEEATDFCGAIRAAPTASLPLTGAVAGLRWGPAAIPAAWSTHTTGAVGTRTYGLRQLRRLAERLMRQDAPCSTRTSPLTRPPRSCPWAVSLQLARRAPVPRRPSRWRGDLALPHDRHLRQPPGATRIRDA